MRKTGKFKPGKSYLSTMAEVTAAKNEQVAKLNFGSIYPHYLTRIQKHGRTKEELDQVILWLTGYDQETLETFIGGDGSFGDFFEGAKMHENSDMIKGVVCGYRIEEIPEEFALYRDCRRMEKLIDELAKGRKMDKILRQEKK
jgi:hypothetical protein